MDESAGNRRHAGRCGRREGEQNSTEQHKSSCQVSLLTGFRRNAGTLGLLNRFVLMPLPAEFRAGSRSSARSGGVPLFRGFPDTRTLLSRSNRSTLGAADGGNEKLAMLAM
jgi:hypothetical protein